jgi:hypothetical protein
LGKLKNKETEQLMITTAAAAPIDAIDELVARSKDNPELREFHRLHRAHPEILDFLVSAIKLRLKKGFHAFSFGSLWDYARWKLDIDLGPNAVVRMNDHAAPYYGRAIMILHPELNGRAECRVAVADGVFGLEIESVKAKKKRPGDYARRLQWADGTGLDAGWRPSIPHVVERGVVKRFNIH